MSRFSYSRRVTFPETDLAKVVHHSNYLRYFEEARVDWLRQNDLLKDHSPAAGVTIAVIETGVKHKLPAYFNDLLRIELQVKAVRLRIRFEYVIYSERFGDKVVATGYSLHFPVDDDFKPCRLPKSIERALEGEVWTEIWP